jgi:hypothetical protein
MCPINAIQYSIYMPAMREITAITLEENALVTTSFDNGYLDGAIVRIDVPQEYGMQQINHLTGTIAIVSPTSFHINIDTRTFDAFIAPVLPLQVAQVVPVGEIAQLYDSATYNVLPFTV